MPVSAIKSTVVLATDSVHTPHLCSAILAAQHVNAAPVSASAGASDFVVHGIASAPDNPSQFSRESRQLDQF